jgi:hypothetical protein
MKYIALLIIFTSCFVAMKDVDTAKRAPALIHQESDKTLIHDPATSQIFVVQHDQPLDKMGSVTLTQGSPGKVVLYNSASQKTTVLEVGENIFGIASLTDDSLAKELVNEQGTNLSLDPATVGVVFQRACRCRANGTTGNDCDAGGPGSDECTIGSDGNVGAATINVGGGKNCSVKCRPTHYACCES